MKFNDLFVSRAEMFSMGIKLMGTNPAANTIEPKVLNSYGTTHKVPVLRSTAAPTNDFWSVKGQSYPAKGGHSSCSPMKKMPSACSLQVTHEAHRLH